MKKYIIAIVLTGLLVGCSDGNKSSIASADNSSVIESTASSETTTVTKSTTTTTTTTTTAETQIEIGSPPPLTLVTADGLTEIFDRGIFDTLSEPPYYFYTYEDSTYYYIMSTNKSTLQYHGHQTNYINSSGEECTDTYYYSPINKTETIINRCINGKTVFVNPVQIYIDQQDDALYINLKDTGETVQKIEVDFSAIDDKSSVKFADYDFDGYDDLFIRMKNGTMFSNGTYYRFVPDIGLFEKWDEMNKIGREMIVDTETSTLREKSLNDDYWLEYFDYKWEDNKLILFEHRVSETGEVMEIYSVDQNGNEKHIGSEVK